MGLGMIWPFLWRQLMGYPSLSSCQSNPHREEGRKKWNKIIEIDPPPHPFILEDFKGLLKFKTHTEPNKEPLAPTKIQFLPSKKLREFADQSVKIYVIFKVFLKIRHGVHNVNVLYSPPKKAMHTRVYCALSSDTMSKVWTFTGQVKILIFAQFFFFKLWMYCFEIVSAFE